MNGEDKAQTEVRSKRRGCLIAILFVAAVVVFIIWQLGEPARQARRVRAAVKNGMSFAEVEETMNGEKGRRLASYRLPKNGSSGFVDRDEFARILSGGTNGVVTNACMRVTFLSSMGSPGRVSFEIKFDGQGRVRSVNAPYSWD